MRAQRFRTFAGAVFIAAAGVGAATGAANAAPLPLTEAAPVTGDGTEAPAGTGSAETLLPLLLSGSAQGPAQSTSDPAPETPGAATGSADVLLPLLPLLLSGSANGEAPAGGE
ncbi:hypothetical protein [Nocardia sp. NPDC024068]|uniref:hypothetical protein n=1 Tax=Nocardia sp. NPDC024068 TaxID=3157197 RepID=UPI0033F94F7E